MIAWLHHHVYIGASECGLVSRYQSRRRKLQQLCNHRFVDCEMALRWWHATDTFFNYIPIWVQTTDTKLAALMAESSWQQAYQPSLVMPWIRSLMLRIQHKSHHLTPTRITPSARSKKLFQRIRKRKLENLGLDTHTATPYRQVARSWYSLLKASTNVENFRSSSTCSSSRFNKHQF